MRKADLTTLALAAARSFFVITLNAGPTLIPYNKREGTPSSPHAVESLVLRIHFTSLYIDLAPLSLLFAMSGNNEIEIPIVQPLTFLDLLYL